MASAGWAAAPARILDGPYSEIVAITGSADGTHVSLATAVQFSHVAGASLSQAGASGSLAEVILRASAWIEGHCQQGTSGGDHTLWALARTERWGMPSVRAYIDRDAVVVVQPGHFPVSAVSALTIEFGQGQSLSLDVTQLEVQTVGRTVEVPYLLGQPSIGAQLWLETAGLSRSRRQWAVLTYTGGIAVGAVPYYVQQACVWVVSDMLAQRQNPSGASETQLGKRRTTHRQRGDLTEGSVLLMRAREALQPCKAEAWA